MQPLAVPTTAPAQAQSVLQTQGYVVLSPHAVQVLSGCAVPALNALNSSWNDLIPDAYLKDGGRYRRRRHSCFEVQGASVQQVPHRAHWQPVEYNALNGGMQRWFEPLAPETVEQPVWAQLLAWLGAACTEQEGSAQAGNAKASSETKWFVEAHQFRIDTTDGIGRPTPEGAHRDGVDYVAVFMVGRSGIKGGETRVFESAGPNGQRFTLTEPWSLLLLDDERVIHESTPIQPLEAHGHRDTLVVTLRKGGFQGNLE